MSEGSQPKQKPELPLWARKGLLSISGWMKKTAGTTDAVASPGDVTLAIKSNEDRSSLAGPAVGVTAASPVEGEPVWKNPASLDSGPSPMGRRPPASLTGRRRRPSANRLRLNAEDGATSTRIAYITDIEGNWECAAILSLSHTVLEPYCP